MKAVASALTVVMLGPPSPEVLTEADMRAAVEAERFEWRKHCPPPRTYDECLKKSPWAEKDRNLSIHLGVWGGLFVASSIVVIATAVVWARKQREIDEFNAQDFKTAPYPEEPSVGLKVANGMSDAVTFVSLVALIVSGIRRRTHRAVSPDTRLAWGQD